MAKDYSKAVYAGARWHQTKEAYLASVNFICERCGAVAKIVHHRTYINPNNVTDPNILYDWANLEALCQTCHNQEHHSCGNTRQGLKFDSAGNLVKC